MKKQLIIASFFLILVSNVSAKFGIGAAGGIIYPGFSKSDLFVIGRNFPRSASIAVSGDEEYRAVSELMKNHLAIRLRNSK